MFQVECCVAAGAAEVYVPLIDGACVVAVAYAIFGGAGAVFGFVEEMVPGEEGEGAENGGLVNGSEFVLQISE